jgi:Aromatic acid exporter family member 1
MARRITLHSPRLAAPYSRAALARAAGSARLALIHGGPERNAFLLLCKAALATVLAWEFAVRVLHSPTPFYAPMAALLVVDRTLVRSLWASVQRIAAVVLGMSVAWAVGSVVGVRWWSIGAVLDRERSQQPMVSRH